MVGRPSGGIRTRPALFAADRIGSPDSDSHELERESPAAMVGRTGLAGLVRPWRWLDDGVVSDQGTLIVPRGARPACGVGHRSPVAMSGSFAVGLLTMCLQTRGG